MFLFYVNLAGMLMIFLMFLLSIRYNIYGEKEMKNIPLTFAGLSFMLWNVSQIFFFFNMKELENFFIIIFILTFSIVPTIMISHEFKFKHLHNFELFFLLFSVMFLILMMAGYDEYSTVSAISTFNVIFSLIFVIIEYSRAISFTRRSKILNYAVFYGLFSAMELIFFWLKLSAFQIWDYVIFMNSILLPVYLYALMSLSYGKQIVKASIVFFKNVIYGIMISLLISSILIVSYYANIYFSRSSDIFQFFFVAFILIFLSFMVFGDYLQKIDLFFEQHLRTGMGYKRGKMIEFVRKIPDTETLEECDALAKNFCFDIFNTEDVEIFFREDNGSFRSTERTIAKDDLNVDESKKIIDLYVTWNRPLFLQDKEFLVWIMNSGKIEGFLLLGHKKIGKYTSEDLEWIETLSNHISFFLSRYRSIQKIKRAEETLRFQERMAAIGKLSAGVAHEIRNPLNIISTSFQLLKEKPEEKDKLWRYIQEELSRVNAILENFLEFSRQRAPSIEEGDPSEIIKKTAFLLGDSASKKSVDVGIELPDQNRIVKFDRSMLMEILLNVGTNALDAIEDGGKITFKLGYTEKYFVISVSNNGQPIPPSDLPHIFEPFYTTKESGTGLGLAIVYNYVNKMNGRIDVRSDEKETIFSIFIPVEANL